MASESDNPSPVISTNESCSSSTSYVLSECSSSPRITSNSSTRITSNTSTSFTYEENESFLQLSGEISSSIYTEHFIPPYSIDLENVEEPCQNEESETENVLVAEFNYTDYLCPSILNEFRENEIENQNLHLYNPVEVLDENVEEENFLFPESDDEHMQENQDRFEKLLCMLKTIKKTHKGISDVAMKEILGCFRFMNIPVPKDSRTLENRNRRKIQTTIINNGTYVYFGVEKNLKALITANSELQGKTDIEIDISTDGVKLFKASENGLWITSAALANFRLPPFVIGIYEGSEKPGNVELFFEELLKELDNLRNFGFNLTKHNVVFVKVRAIICDAPARQMCTGTIGHGAFKGCPFCIQIGTSINHTMNYAKEKKSLRTNESFRNRLDPGHHKSRSPFENYGYYDMVLDFVIDVMHCFDLGIIKQMITALGKILNPNEIEEFNRRMLYLKKFIPKDFSRKPRILKHVKLFKAIECRLFGLYLAFVVLKDLSGVSDARSTHFLTFSVAYRLLLTVNPPNNIHCNSMIRLADSGIRKFVHDFKTYYGNKLTYNVHMSLHVPALAEKFGSVDTFSAYKYENSYQIIRNGIKKPNQVLQQAYNSWLDSIEAPDNTKKFDNLFYSSKQPDNCVYLRNHEIFLINKVIKQGKLFQLKGKRYFRRSEAFRIHNQASSSLFIWKVSDNHMSAEYTIDAKLVRFKFMRLPYPIPPVSDTTEPTSFIVIPVIHTSKQL